MHSLSNSSAWLMLLSCSDIPLSPSYPPQGSIFAAGRCADGPRSGILEFAQPGLHVAQLLLGHPHDFLQRFFVFELLRLLLQIAVQASRQVATDGIKTLLQLVALLLEFVSIHAALQIFAKSYCRIR